MNKRQRDKWEIDEQNGSHLLTGDKQEKEDQEESNVPSRRGELKDTNCPSEMEVSAMRMAQDMKMMKEKMDIMMNA